MKIKRMILVAGLIVVFCLSALPAAALETVPVQDSLRVEPVSLSALAASEIRVERTADTGLVTETTYGNLQAFIEKARAQNGTTDAEIAEELLRATGSADLAEMYTAEELSEVLNYAEIVRSTVYYRVSRDGTKRRSRRRRPSTQGDARWSPPVPIYGRVGKPPMTAICRFIRRGYG